MQLSTHLNFSGQCEAAFKFYQKCLGGENLWMMKWADSPAAAQAPPGWADKIIHATLTTGAFRLLGADSPPGYYEKPQGFAVVFDTRDAAEAERVFVALSENAQKTTMPLQETFWAVRYGMVVDQFGTPWMVNCGKPV